MDGHNVVLFSQDDKQSLASRAEVSEDFFEVTKEDIRRMQSDLNARKYVSDTLYHESSSHKVTRTNQYHHLPRANLEDRPLETQKMREERLHREEKKYEFTIIRVLFPFDHLIMQTTFKPTDTIEQLRDLVKRFVTVDDFYLYTAPPKKVLDLKSTFLKEKLVPAVQIQFGGHQKCVLKADCQQQISSFIYVVSYTDELRSRLKNQRQRSLEQQEAGPTEVDLPQPEQSSAGQDAAAERAKKEERLMKLLNMK